MSVDASSFTISAILTLFESLRHFRMGAGPGCVTSVILHAKQKTNYLSQRNL